MQEINQSYEIALDTLVILRRMFRSKGQISAAVDFSDHVSAIVTMIL